MPKQSPETTTFETTADLIRQSRLKPTPGRLLCRLDLQQQYGSLLLPPSAQFETATAVIIRLGDDLPFYLQEGLRVLPHEHSGLEVAQVQHSRYIIYELKDLQAVFLEGATPEAQALIQEKCAIAQKKA